ncbi:MAG: DUF1592 domain-containing protein, partial [Planctomycetota bacterium]
MRTRLLFSLLLAVALIAVFLFTPDSSALSSWQRDGAGQKQGIDYSAQQEDESEEDNFDEQDFDEQDSDEDEFDDEFEEDFEEEDFENDIESLRRQKEELSRELQWHAQQQASLQARVERIEKLIELQQRFKRLDSQIMEAYDSGSDEQAESLENEIVAVEFEIERLHWLNESDDHRAEINRIRNELKDAGADEFLPIADVADEALDSLNSLREMMVSQESGVEEGEGDFEQIEERVWLEERRLEMAHECFGLLEELRYALEDGDDEAAEELFEELEMMQERLVSGELAEFDEDFEGEFEDEDFDEQRFEDDDFEGEMEEDFDDDEDRRESRRDRSVNREPLKPVSSEMLPIAITESGLQSVANLNLQSDLEPLLDQYCLACHDSGTADGDLDLETMIETTPIVKNRDHWINVIAQLQNRAMPPADSDQPTEEERTKLTLALYQKINSFDYSTVAHPGYEPSRRLSHEEYNNTIRDLVGMDLRPTDRFPTDMTGSSGFDNSANTLFIQPLLMERYMNAADFVVEQAFPAEVTTAAQQAVRQKVFGDVSPTTASPRDVIRNFVSRAYRRPLDEDELDRSVRHFDNARQNGLDELSAYKAVFQATLVSPKFLMKHETVADESGTFRVNDWELASRLSYFLWATMPDDELFRLARDGQLHQPEVLDAQVERMLDDTRAMTLGSVFAAQWLGSINLGTRVRMDPIDNPWCTDSLMKAMRDETALFFHSLITDNASLPKLINADYTFLNEELAGFYRIRGVEGQHMQRVSLRTADRGGIFGQGSLLAVTSFPGRTSPVVRGQWILDTVLGTPPPPPPPNVSEFEEEVEESERLSFREKLELHRASANCYACHSQMDPLGLSLEG